MPPADKLLGVAARWRKLHGEDSWSGLLAPLDPSLRLAIIHYGELAQVTYDTFVREKKSRRAGMCMFTESGLFSGARLSSPELYAVTKFFYATSTIAGLPEAFLLKSLPLSREPGYKESNWMGYVAVATDAGVAALGRRDIVVAWRGTVEALEWIDDFDNAMVSAAELAGGGKVHRGFHSMYTSTDEDSVHNKNRSARDQVFDEMTRLLKEHAGEECSITVVGQSLGATLATLNAVDIAANGANRPPSGGDPCPVTAVVFGSPRVGDEGFKAAVESTPHLRILSVRNAPDILLHAPPSLAGYRHVGVELAINTKLSPFVKEHGTKPLVWHTLEMYLHGVAGVQRDRPDGELGFELVVDRDVALVNKYFDALKDEYPVPAEWWVHQFKGMVLGDDGRWRLQDGDGDGDGTGADAGKV